MLKLATPLTRENIGALRAGDEVLISGTILTARDTAHKRFHDAIAAGRRIPLDLEGAVIYYAGPTPGRGKRPVGSCGPTTSSRMDAFTPALLHLGVAGMIGKGTRSDEVRKAIKKYGAVYFLAVGGIGALLGTKIKSVRCILYKDLGPEAVYKLEVKDFPLIVGIDSKGHDIYETCRRKKR
jgi:fumarate hydratase subunit beta